MKNDLISRSALLEEISKCTIIPDDLYSMGIMAGVDAIKKKVENAPAVDAVEIVRCKDCKHCFFDLSGRAFHLCMRHGVTARYRVLSEDFCRYGERRGDDGK